MILNRYVYIILYVLLNIIYIVYYLNICREKVTRILCDSDIKHCTKSKFCAIRDRSKIIEPLLESYPQVVVTISLNGFTSYLLAIV